MDFVVYNPSIGIYKELNLCLLGKSHYYCSTVGFGFGYDEVNNDYKIVMLDPQSIDLCEILVHSLKVNSWRHIGVRFNATFIMIGPAVVMESRPNLLHFLFKFGYEIRIGILDIHSEQWSEHVLPHKIKIDDDLWESELGLIDDCLYIWNYHSFLNSDGQDVPYELWVMKEYGVKESWSKVLNFCLRKDRHLKPICYSKSSRENIVLWDTNKCAIIVYNVKGNTATGTRIKGLNGNQYALYLCNETLVSIPGAKSRTATTAKGNNSLSNEHSAVRQ